MLAESQQPNEETRKRLCTQTELTMQEVNVRSMREPHFMVASCIAST